jgi:hypothetical protein
MKLQLPYNVLEIPHIGMVGWGYIEPQTQKSHWKVTLFSMLHRTGLVPQLCTTDLVWCPTTLASHSCSDRFSALESNVPPVSTRLVWWLPRQIVVADR